MGASVRGLRLSGSVDAIVDYAGRQTLPDTGITPDGEGIVGYYDAGLSRWEPVGHWGGRQADADGLDQVRRVELARMVSGLDPNTGMPLGHLPRQGAVVAWDLTFTTPKSVSALWALSPTAARDAIVDAVDVAAAVALELVDRDGAFTRVGPRGAVQVVDAAGLRAAQFRQVTSRAGDPHLHVHTLIGSRVQAPDGSWHALDARWMVRYQQAIGRVFDHELAGELQRRLGVRLDWSSGHPEIAGVPEALTRMWSQRHTQIDAHLDQAVAGFRETRGREPTGLERAELNQIAWQTTRTAKAELPGLDVLERQWRTEARIAGVEIPLPLEPEPGSRFEALLLGRQTQRLLEAERSTWTRMDALDAALRTAAAYARALPVADADRLVDRLTDGWIDIPGADTIRSPRRADGASTAWSATAGRHTSDRVIADETTITEVAIRAQAAPALPSATINVDGLDGAQIAAARLLAGTSRLPIVVGAAGTAKTTLIGRVVDHATRQGQRVLLVAPTRVAAGQLAAVTGGRPPDDRAAVTVDTIAGYLNRVGPRRHGAARYDLVIVDEAGMVGTGELAALLEIGEQRQQRTALVGDWAQLDPVGRGGMFARLVHHHGDGHLVELDTVHRFAEPWEAETSLLLRLGDSQAICDYYNHRRLGVGTLGDAAEHAARAWLAGEQLLVTCSTNDTARAVAGHIQHRLRQAGHIDTRRVVSLRSGHTAGAGDHIVTRHNLRQRTDRGEIIANRHRWTIEHVHDDGSLTATGQHGRTRLNAAYVAEHVELGYAGTVHSAQALTVDRAVVIVDDHTTHAALYVGATRGHHHNLLWITTQPGEQLDNHQTLGRLDAALQRDRHDAPVLDQALNLTAADRQLADQAVTQSCSRGRGR